MEQKDFDKAIERRLTFEKPEIKCPHCGYDGNDLKIGRRQVTVTNTGVPRILCSKCGRYFVIKSLL